ncbi:MAG: twin-arginine translocation signal domain-containing protein [Trueperaceae bacterium]
MNRRSFLKITAAGTAALALGQWRFALAQSDSRNLIVVSNAGDGAAGVGPSVSLIDPDSLEVVATLPLAGSYSFPATRWDFERDLIWAGGPNEAVHAWRLSTGESAVELPTGSGQNYTELTPDGRHLIVAARFADRYLKIGADPQSDDFGQVAAEFDTYAGASPCDMTITSDGAYAYAPDRGGDTITTVRLDPFERASVTPVESFDGAPLEPYMATVSPTGNVLLVENAIVDGGSDNGSESIFDLSDPANPVEVARLSRDEGLGVGPITSEITLDGRYGLVICRDSSELSVIDTGSLEVVGAVTFPEGSNPLTGTFVFGSQGEHFFVPLPGRDAVAVVSVPEFKLVELLPVGARPMGVVYLQAALPERQGAGHRLGVALAGGRTFPPGCPDRCCGPV